MTQPETRWSRWRRWARQLKTQIRALLLASKHPRTPWFARTLAILVVAYAFSPIDLIPDPIPILGYLDDLILLPIGIWLTLRLIPKEVWTECVERANSMESTRPRSWVAAGVIVLLWVAVAVLVARELWPGMFRSR